MQTCNAVLQMLLTDRPLENFIEVNNVIYEAGFAGTEKNMKMKQQTMEDTIKERNWGNQIWVIDNRWELKKFIYFKTDIQMDRSEI